MKKLLVLTTLMLGAFMVQAQKVEKTSPQYKAADELMTTMNMSQSVSDGINDMVESQAQANPMLAGKKDALKTFMQKYMSWDVLREDYINLYATEFTESELKELTAFYKTPLGKKLAAKQSAISVKSQEIAQSKMQEHMSELMELMQK